MDVNEHIADFLRDATYRLAEITNELEGTIIDKDAAEYKKLNGYRQDIWLFSRVIFYGSHFIYQAEKSGFTNDWTDNEIIEEIEYIRDRVGISEIPWVSYTNYMPNLIVRASGGGIEVEEDPFIKVGQEGDLVEYDQDQKTLRPISKPVLLGFSGDIATYYQRALAYGYILNGTFTEAEWAGENPLLLSGEMGIAIIGGLGTKFKLGPGRWNDLNYFTEKYSIGDVVTNPIGDAINTAAVQDESIESVIKLMLSPYAEPVIQNLQNDAGGGYLSESIIILGNTISGGINIQFTVSNSANLDGATPINVTAGGVFSNEGDFANGSPINLTLASDLTPTQLTNIEIKVKATHTNGVTQEFSTFIRFRPEIIWGVSALNSLTASELAAITAKQLLTTEEYAGEYDYTQSGYLYLAIPVTLSPSNLFFADTTNPLISLPIDMVDLGVVTNVNPSGAGAYNYQVFRTQYSISENSTKITIQ